MRRTEDGEIKTLDQELLEVFERHGIKVHSYSFHPLPDEEDGTGEWIVKGEH